MIYIFSRSIGIYSHIDITIQNVGNMTTLTVLQDEESKSPLISLNPVHTIGDIDPMIYGGFTEFVDPQIYTAAAESKESKLTMPQTHGPLHLRRHL
jgi:hypothetical protein